MAKKKRKKTPEDLAFDERTRMINEYIARLRAQVDARKAAEQPSS
jgi:hypothetical protein